MELNLTTTEFECLSVMVVETLNKLEDELNNKTTENLTETKKDYKAIKRIYDKMSYYHDKYNLIRWDEEPGIFIQGDIYDSYGHPAGKLFNGDLSDETYSMIKKDVIENFVNVNYSVQNMMRSRKYKIAEEQYIDYIKKHNIKSHKIDKISYANSEYIANNKCFYLRDEDNNLLAHMKDNPMRIVLERDPKRIVLDQGDR
jgi:hypothetical protein